METVLYHFGLMLRFGGSMAVFTHHSARTLVRPQCSSASVSVMWTNIAANKVSDCLQAAEVTDPRT
jgi:hypothetical protein